MGVGQQAAWTTWGKCTATKYCLGQHLARSLPSHQVLGSSTGLRPVMIIASESTKQLTNHVGTHSALGRACRQGQGGEAPPSTRSLWKSAEGKAGELCKPVEVGCRRLADRLSGHRGKEEDLLLNWWLWIQRLDPEGRSVGERSWGRKRVSDHPWLGRLGREGCLV